MSGHDPIRELRKACKALGSQKAFAARHGLSDAYVSDVLKGRREPGDCILRALGLRKVITYTTVTPDDAMSALRKIAADKRCTEPVAFVPKGHLERYLKGKNTGCWVYGAPTAADDDRLYTASRIGLKCTNCGGDVDG